MIICNITSQPLDVNAATDALPCSYFSLQLNVDILLLPSFLILFEMHFFCEFTKESTVLLDVYALELRNVTVQNE